MAAAWSWETFFTYLVHKQILLGLWTTLWLTFVTLGLAIVIGTLAALFSRLPHRAAAWGYTGYVGLFRATPLLVQLVFLYSALPQLGFRLSVVECAIIGLAVAESPYIAEIFRSSIASVQPGQWEAARALGMQPLKVLRVIILPQAARVALPPTGNEFIRQLKNTSLVSVISMTELYRAADTLLQTSFRVLEGLSVATFYYVVVFAIWTGFQRLIERRLNVWFAEVPTARPLVQET